MKKERYNTISEKNSVITKEEDLNVTGIKVNQENHEVEDDFIDITDNMVINIIKIKFFYYIKEKILFCYIW